MSVITITPKWTGQDAFIIGGGSSLRGYDFGKLAGRNVIGINDAFRLGVEACPASLFGDAIWWQRAKFDLEVYAKAGGTVYSIAPGCINLKCPWLYVLRRVDSGYASGDHLAWNNSTGAAGINLAANLGAKRIFLLGFDCTKAPDRKTHWHNYHRTPTADHSFERFLRGFHTLYSKMQELAPDVLVLNTNPQSRLNHWQKCTTGDMERLMNEPH